ncbi:hypothetical protein ACQVA2_13740 [Citrobacter sp. OP27]
MKGQIQAAKTAQRENARRRSKEATRRTSSASTSNTQSEVTERPPQVYRVPQINVPQNLHDAAKLIQGELTKIAQSQSIILTLWEKLRGQVAGADSVQFNVPVNFTDGIALNGVPVTDWRFRGTYEWDGVPWTADTGLYIERNSSDTASDMVIQFYGGGGGSCPAMQFRVDYKTGGLSYRSARDKYGFEVDFVKLATQTALEQAKKDIFTTLRVMNPGLLIPAE